MSDADARTGRRYHGLTAAERTARRRAAILRAALELFGTHGYAASSVKQVCRSAQLTERYFYESFTDREDCLASLYDELIDRLESVTLTAVEHATADPAYSDPVDASAAAGLDALVRDLTSDRRRARVILIEVVGVSDAMEIRRHRVLWRFADLVLGVWTGDAEASTRARLMAMALVGGLNHLLVDWLMGDGTAQPSELIAAGTDLFAGARQRLDAPG